MTGFHIKQKSNWDCVIASVAMMTGKSYEEVLKRYEKLYPKHNKCGLNDEEILGLLKSFKQNPRVINAVIKNVSGILYLPSKNDSVGDHAVFFDGECIYDPNFKIKGKKYYNKKVPKKFPEGTQKVVNMNNPQTKKLVKKLDKINSEH
jgi:hypothetical protein